MDIKLTSGSLTTQLSVADGTQVVNVSGNGMQCLTDALESPLGLPKLCQCSVPGDRIVIVVDPNTPQITNVINAAWEQLHAAEATELNITLLLPEDCSGNDWQQLIDELPVHIRKQSIVHIHDPADELQRQYLASSAGGDRIYLSQHLVDADLIVTLGTIAFDGLLGYRGTNSGIFPVLSDTHTISAARGTAHSELTPDDKRPLRELMDEVGWLLGTQFSVQVIPDSTGDIGFAFCGLPDQVMAAGQTCLSKHWHINVPEQLEAVVLSVNAPSPQMAWKAVGTALEAASKIVEEDGRLILVADLPNPDSPAFNLLRRSSEPADLLKPLSLEPQDDAAEVSQLIRALGQHRVYLLSSLSAEVVEETGILAITNEAELQRIVATSNRTIMLHGGNSCWLELS